jgi:uroporphyrin-III C-methyltransferase/precorrin-2 dehydrogenase/sirohydrochlorin ferrochelatase
LAIAAARARRWAVHSLPLFLRLQGRPVILLGEGEAAAAKRRLIERAGAVVVGEGDSSAVLAIVALDDDAEAEAAVARLRASGVLVNAVDRPALCDFTLPAIIDRDPVLIAIGTGGASAGLAKALRQRLEAILPATLGRLAEALFARRSAIRARWPDPSDRRRAIDAALGERGPLDPLADQPAEAVAEWLRTDAQLSSGKCVAIRLRSGDPDDLSVREARLLGGADRIYHRPDVPPAILERARADAVRIPCGARPQDAGQGLSIDLGWEGR